MRRVLHTLKTPLLLFVLALTPYQTAPQVPQLHAAQRAAQAVSGAQARAADCRGGGEKVCAVQGRARQGPRSGTATAGDPAGCTSHCSYNVAVFAVIRAWPNQDLLNLAPKKPNWDLKRDLARKLAPLEKVTKRAIAELIRTLALASYGTLVLRKLTRHCHALICRPSGERILSESDSAGQLGATMAAQQELTVGDESD